MDSAALLLLFGKLREEPAGVESYFLFWFSDVRNFCRVRQNIVFNKTPCKRSLQTDHAQMLSQIFSIPILLEITLLVLPGVRFSET